ncbi:MAG: 4-hydroxy-3-methylbut-2-enyl diphosphate reductase [Elusimicrobia bacterium]|nr:4-hydroxy-3-methylbut-2-enyl diphosphate reductase [Elusimicrobiota bacterium]
MKKNMKPKSINRSHSTKGEVKIAKLIGFCSGVTVAVRGTEKILGIPEKSPASKKVYCVGHLIHNSNVIMRLRKKGLRVVRHVKSVPEKTTVVIRAHGLPVDEIKTLKKKNCEIRDFTCPILKKIHRTIERLRNEEFFIVIVGNPAHAEVRALRSHAGENCAVVENEKQARNFKKKRKIAVICQSTITEERFLKIAGLFVGKARELYILNTICAEVTARRIETIRLAKISKMVIIVGDKKSSNTRHLAEIAKNFCRVRIVSDAKELEKGEIVYPLTITSGASSPEDLVMEIYGKVVKKDD